MKTTIEIKNRRNGNWEAFLIDFGRDTATAEKYAADLRRGGREVRVISQPKISEYQIAYNFRGIGATARVEAETAKQAVGLFRQRYCGKPLAVYLDGKRVDA